MEVFVNGELKVYVDIREIVVASSSSSSSYFIHSAPTWSMGHP
jgi:hypothetical protein